MSPRIALSDLDQKRIELVIRQADQCHQVLGTGHYFADQGRLLVDFDHYSDRLDRVCLILSEDDWDGDVEESSQIACDYCIRLDVT